MRSMQDVTIIPFAEQKPQIAASAFIASGARIIGNVTLGDNTNIWFNTVIRGDVHFIRIGVDTNIQDNSTIHVTTKTHPTIIGNKVTVGHQAVVHGCQIDDLCLIGMGAIVLDGVKVGEKSIVGAGSLLPPGKTYPPACLIVGSPAKVKRELSPEEIAFLTLSADHYVKTSHSYDVHCQV